MIFHHKWESTFSLTWPSGPGQSSSCDVHLCIYIYIYVPPNVIYFEASHWPPQLAGSTREQPIGMINQVAADWQDQPGSSPLAGSTR